MIKKNEKKIEEMIEKPYRTEFELMVDVPKALVENSNGINHKCSSPIVRFSIVLEVISSEHEIILVIIISSPEKIYYTSCEKT